KLMRKVKRMIQGYCKMRVVSIPQLMRKYPATEMTSVSTAKIKAILLPFSIWVATNFSANVIMISKGNIETEASPVRRYMPPNTSMKRMASEMMETVIAKRGR